MSLGQEVVGTCPPWLIQEPFGKCGRRESQQHKQGTDGWGGELPGCRAKEADPRLSWQVCCQQISALSLW